MTYKILHIHSNPTFIHDTLRFENENLLNTIIFVGEYTDLVSRKLDGLPFKYEIVSDIELITKKASNYDGVVLNYLDDINTQILEKLPLNNKIFLRLFGAELYYNLISKYVSEKTFYSIYNIPLNPFSMLRYLKLLKRIASSSTVKLKIRKLRAVYKKIDNILLVNEFEYKDLKRDFYLPKFIPLYLNRKTSIDFQAKNDTIILGNSRHFWNNHLDIFDELDKAKVPDKVKFKLFFSYGNVPFYEDEVRKRARNLKNTEIIEEFLPYEEFESIYNKASAIVINSYRQHALGNIFTALLAGCKLYLNHRSSTYKWLNSENFYVSELEDLATDIKNNTFNLSLEEMTHNVKTYEKLQKNYTKVDFVEEIINVLKE